MNPTTLTVFSYVFMVATLAFGFFAPEVAFWMRIAAVLPVGYIVLAQYYYFRSTSRKLKSGIKSQNLKFFTESVPNYKFPDYFLAIEHLVKEHTLVRKLERSHYQGLGGILNRNIDDLGDLLGDEIDNLAWDTSYKESTQMPEDCFWVLRYKPTHEEYKNKTVDVILRLRYSRQYHVGVFETASAIPEIAQEIKKWAYQYTNENSIYRNKLISVNIIESRVRRGFDEMPTQLQIFFKSMSQISEEEIILEDHHRNIIKRNVFDFAEHKKDLLELGLSGQKGILLYGPPGTGKTFTCRYIYSKIPNITTIIVTGHHLSEIRSICQIAKAYQPSLLIMEDVDMAFSSREINFYSTAMGDFMDELDGLKDDDNLIFLMTTNAIERVESAIRDRPGRINQCIKFDYPKDPLRKLCFEHFLKPYDSSALDFDYLVKLTGKVSQVFIKELVLHAVHIALEKTGFDKTIFKLQNEHFKEAFEELTSQNSKYVDSILGFR